MLEKLVKNNFGELRIYNTATDGWYIVQWISDVYILQDNISMKKYNHPEYAYTCKMVCAATFRI